MISNIFANLDHVRKSQSSAHSADLEPKKRRKICPLSAFFEKIRIEKSLLHPFFSFLWRIHDERVILFDNQAEIDIVSRQIT